MSDRMRKQLERRMKGAARQGAEAFQRALPTEAEWERLTDVEREAISQLMETGAREFGAQVLFEA